MATLDLSGLPPAERAGCDRELAGMHLRLGQEATVAEARAAHLELAALWTRLAAQAERQAAEGPAQVSLLAAAEPGKPTASA